MADGLDSSAAGTIPILDEQVPGVLPSLAKPSDPQVASTDSMLPPVRVGNSRLDDDSGSAMALPQA